MLKTQFAPLRRLTSIGATFGLVLAIATSSAWGGGWSEQTVGDLFRAVHFPASQGTTGYAVGAGGVIYKTTDSGGTWVDVQDLTKTIGLRAVHFPALNTGYAVGDGGTILKTTDGGGTWSDVQDPVHTNILDGVQFLDVNTGYAVGVTGDILKTADGGGTWTNVQDPARTNRLYGVHFPVDELTGYVVGMSGAALKTINAGATWTDVQDPGETSSLHSVHFQTDELTGYAVGNGGTILKTTDAGLIWVPQNSGTSQAFHSVHFPVDATTGYAVGFNGTIVKTTDSGSTWIDQLSTTNRILLSVWFPVDATTGYAVGGLSGTTGTIVKTTDGGGLSIVLHPTGIGSQNTFTTATGCATGNWDCVNDQTGNAGTGPAESNDGTTSYLQDASGSTNREMFSLDNGTIPGGSTVNAIKVSAWLGHGGNPKPKVRPSYRRIGTDPSPVDGGQKSVNTSGCCGKLVEETWSGLGWTTSDLDALEIGAAHASGNILNLSQIYVKVYYSTGAGGGPPKIVRWREVDPN